VIKLFGKLIMRVKASPTKEFFITMLTRDISLDRAILDLIDNSIDAAHVSGNLDDKEIKISISSGSFSIEDNCGGISEDIAQNYAFRFGRDNKDNRNTPSSVGQFGVGMKRTLFKLGKLFKVESSFVSPNGEQSFYIDIDVDAWLAESSDEWGFDLIRAPVTVSRGTKISVNSLLKSVSEQFSSNEFIQSIANDIAQAHFKALNQGLKVTINEVPIKPFEIMINTSDQLKPIVYSKEFEEVKISITAGVSSQDYQSYSQLWCIENQAASCC
jgi:DNA topoisomerase VI subunit B